MRTQFSIFFLCICGILSAQSPLLSEYQQKWQNAAEYTIEVAELMPEDKYGFSPTEGTRTFKDQLLHMMSNMVWLSSSYLDDQKFEKDLKKTDYTKAEIIALLKETTAFAEKAMEKMDVKSMEEEVDFLRDR